MLGWDHRFWLPECAVVMDEGRDGGSPGSPAGPVKPRMRLPVEERFCSVGVMAMMLISVAPLESLQAA